MTEIEIAKDAKKFREKKTKEIKEKIEKGTVSDFEKSSLEKIDQKKIEQEQEKARVKLEYLQLINGRFKDFARASEVLVKFIKSKLIIYTTKEDEKSEVWIYKDGIYVPQGRSEIKSILRDVLGEQYTIFILNIVLSKIEPDTFIESTKFFSNNYVDEIPVLNGILNVNTLELKPFDPKKIFFNKIPVTYDPSARCEKIEKFLRDVLAKEDDINIIYELAGFGLLKEYTFEKAFMFVGDGRNGKGKTIELLKRFVGVENTCSVQLSSLTPDNFSISELFGKLFNLAGDIGSTDLKETNMLKSCTGRDMIEGKRKFLKSLFFTNFAKFVFACNDLPMVYDTSKGFWDRWILLEYPYTFVTKEEFEKERDKTYFKIKDEEIISKICSPEELSGLLNEALVGLARLFKNKKFSSTQGSEEVKNTWIRKSNSFMAFCYDYLEDDYEGKISKKELRKRYSEYCKKHKVTGKSDFVIKRVLQELFGATEERISLGDFHNIYEWHWLGIKWKESSKSSLYTEKEGENEDSVRTATPFIPIGEVQSGYIGLKRHDVLQEEIIEEKIGYDAQRGE